MTALAGVVRSFAALLAPRKDNPARSAAWITAAREADLPHVHSFARDIDQDTDAVIAAVTLEHHNGRTEGVNTKVTPQAADVRKCRPCSPAPPHPSSDNTTESAPEPILEQSLRGWRRVGGEVG